MKEKPSDSLNLSQSERRLKEAEIIAKLGSWELDLVNNILTWSDEIYRIFDTTPQSFGATYEAFLGFIHPDDRDMVNKAYTESVENKTPYGPIIHRLMMPDGKIKFVEERGETEYNNKGNPTRSIGTVQDITERITGEQAIIQLKEKEVLLKEIYHRVKNNLQLVSSLLAIQADKIKDENVKKLFITAQNRIKSIAIIHQQLYQSKNLTTVNINDYIRRLIANIKDTLTDVKAVNFEISATNDSMSMDIAISCGLILNEIISNSFKYAFDDQGGVIKIIISKKDNQWKLEISDNGKGAEHLEDYAESDTMGIYIIKSLTQQLNGEMIIESKKNQGVKYNISF